MDLTDFVHTKNDMDTGGHSYTTAIACTRYLPIAKEANV